HTRNGCWSAPSPACWRGVRVSSLRTAWRRSNEPTAFSFWTTAALPSSGGGLSLLLCTNRDLRGCCTPVWQRRWYEAIHGAGAPGGVQSALLRAVCAVCHRHFLRAADSVGTGDARAVRRVVEQCTGWR